MVSVRFFSLIVAYIAIGGFAADATQIVCSNTDQRCVPIRHCSPVNVRVRNNEHKTDVTFLYKLKSMICQSEDLQDNRTYICCPRSNIECHLNGKPGACVQRERCPKLMSTTEEMLMRSSEKNLCYVHKKKKYFCCTDGDCTSNKKLCDQEGPTASTTSAFPDCRSSGAAGSLVPRMLCSDYPAGSRRPVRNTDNDRVCCAPPSPDRLISHRKARKLDQTLCGTTALVDKIQHGENAKYMEFPWMAKLVYKLKPTTCSGTLIHPRYVLTAEHCIKSDIEKVLLGVHDSRYMSKEVQEIKIKSPFKNKLYDVGLLRLANSATVDGDFVQTICLPIFSRLRMYLPPKLIISGWGNTEKNRASHVLLKADTMVLRQNDKDCNKDHTICAGGVNHSNHCPGDSGGPYQALSTFGEHHGRRVVQYGIISEGPAYCSDPDRPSKGLLVGYVLDWILDHMDI